MLKEPLRNSTSSNIYISVSQLIITFDKAKAATSQIPKGVRAEVLYLSE